ncbi:MAG: hypothetical protein JSW68_11630 [Burkholderiales bacterium]|nr:MAG: hypothetical protein JSW68_11630 [Burkholderiales bacterium]
MNEARGSVGGAGASLKTGKRTEHEQNFFEHASVDRLAQALFAMAGELHVLRDRVRCLEFMLAEKGSIEPGALDAFEPDPQQPQVLAREREALVAHLMDPLDGLAKSTSGPPLQE